MPPTLAPVLSHREFLGKKKTCLFFCRACGAFSRYRRYTFGPHNRTFSAHFLNWSSIRRPQNQPFSVTLGLFSSRERSWWMKFSRDIDRTRNFNRKYVQNPKKNSRGRPAAARDNFFFPLLSFAMAWAPPPDPGTCP